MIFFVQNEFLLVVCGKFSVVDLSIYICLLCYAYERKLA